MSLIKNIQKQKEALNAINNKLLELEAQGVTIRENYPTGNPTLDTLATLSLSHYYSSDKNDIKVIEGYVNTSWGNNEFVNSNGEIIPAREPSKELNALIDMYLQELGLENLSELGLNPYELVKSRLQTSNKNSTNEELVEL